MLNTLDSRFRVRSPEDLLTPTADRLLRRDPAALLGDAQVYAPAPSLPRFDEPMTPRVASPPPAPAAPPTTYNPKTRRFVTPPPVPPTFDAPPPRRVRSPGWAQAGVALAARLLGRGDQAAAIAGAYGNGFRQGDEQQYQQHLADWQRGNNQRLQNYQLAHQTYADETAAWDRDVRADQLDWTRQRAIDHDTATTAGQQRRREQEALRLGQAGRRLDQGDTRLTSTEKYRQQHLQEDLLRRRQQWMDGNIGLPEATLLQRVRAADESGLLHDLGLADTIKRDPATGEYSYFGGPLTRMLSGADQRAADTAAQHQNDVAYRGAQTADAQRIAGLRGEVHTLASVIHDPRSIPEAKKAAAARLAEIRRHEPRAGAPALDPATYAPLTPAQEREFQLQERRLQMSAGGGRGRASAITGKKYLTQIDEYTDLHHLSAIAERAFTDAEHRRTESAKRHAGLAAAGAPQNDPRWDQLAREEQAAQDDWEHTKAEIARIHSRLGAMISKTPGLEPMRARLARGEQPGRPLITDATSGPVTVNVGNGRRWTVTPQGGQVRVVAPVRK